MEFSFVKWKNQGTGALTPGPGKQEKEMPQSVPLLKPLSASDLIDETIDLYRMNLLVFFGITAILLVPGIAFKQAFVSTSYMFFGDMVASVIDSLGEFVIVVPFSMLASAALTVAVADRYLGKEISIRHSYGTIIGRLIPLMLTLLIGYLIFIALGIVFVLSLVGFIVGIIFGFMPDSGIPLGVVSIGVFALIPIILSSFVLMIVCFVFLAMLGPTVIIEKVYYFNAMSRAWFITRVRFWAILAVIIVTQIIASIVSIPIAFLTIFIGYENFAISVAAGVLYGLIYGIIIPITLVPTILLYFDARVRKEGFDIELLAQSIGEQNIAQP